MSHVHFTDSAKNDLLGLWLYMAERNPPAADAALDSIKESVLLLANQPEMGRARPELADDLRSFPTRTPYIVFYIPEGGGVMVIRVLHHARDIDEEYFS